MKRRKERAVVVQLDLASWEVEVIWAELGGRGFVGDYYGIPVVDGELNPLPLLQVQEYVAEFLGYAAGNQELTFLVGPIPRWPSGYSPKEIAPFFRGHPRNVVLPDEFNELF